MDDLSKITTALADVDTRLRALPEKAFAERHELLKEQDKLRADAARFSVGADKGRSNEELLSELAGLRSQLSQIESQSIDLVTQAGSGGSGMGNMGHLGGVSLNAQMREASGAGRIQSRIGVVKGLLADRGVDVPEPT